jgi:hypothetical protein
MLPVRCTSGLRIRPEGSCASLQCKNLLVTTLREQMAVVADTLLIPAILSTDAEGELGDIARFLH